MVTSRLSEKLSIVLALMLAVSHLYSGGKITGAVTYEGSVPRMKAIRMGADPICQAKHESPIRSEWLLVGEKGEVGNVFVYIKEGLGDKSFPVPENPVVLDQKGCIYSPHIFGIQASQPLEVLNSDGTLHNVHAVAKANRSFNEAMPAVRKKITKTFDQPEIMVRIKCDVHPWMGSYAGVLNHPYFAVTGEDGVFEIKNLPPGKYTVEAWHERLRTRTATVTVKDEETATVDFKFTRPGKKK
ncbi:MAG: carboxypeptidase regulatory-like domain-containing protein [Candidatus Neomarinimicrobiota bacterium]